MLHLKDNYSELKRIIQWEMVMAVDSLPKFVSQNMPTRKEIAEAINPLPEMYQLAKAEFDVKKITATMNQSLSGMSEKAAPAASVSSGRGVGGIV